MNKILFLDVDGVLNASGKTKERFHGLLGIDPVLMARLHRIIDATDCKIVLSSTWRKYPEHVRHLAEKMGPFHYTRIIGHTPISDRPVEGGWAAEVGLVVAKCRGDEIAEWMAANKFTGTFVILDDDADMGALHPHLVRTDTFEGLTDENANEVIRRFQVNPKLEVVA